MVRIASKQTIQSKEMEPIPFFERQQGGLCRMHALNAYLAIARPDLGRPAYSESEFKKEIASFDAQQHSRFGTSISATDFDAVFSDQRGVIGYILGKHGIYVRHVAIGTANCNTDAAIAAGVFFVYNANHIWIMIRRTDKLWSRVDSLSGISDDNPSFDRTVGLLIPIRDLSAEFAKLANELYDLTSGNIARYIGERYIRGELLGDVEILIGAAIAILEVQLGCRREIFHAVAKLIDDYYTFTSRSRLETSIIHLPPIVRGMYSLCQLSFVQKSQ
jgi:hypothetical protein